MDLEELKELAELEAKYGIQLDDRKIYVLDELNEATGVDLRLKYNIIKRYYQDYKKEPLKDITIDVSSYGGSIYSTNVALDFYEELMRNGVVVNSHTSSVCMSAATIFLCGAPGKRTASKRAKFMLHDLQVSGMSGTAQQIQHETYLLKKEQEEMFQMYVDFASKGLEKKKKPGEVKKWIKKYCGENLDHYLSSEDMLKIKLIDEIV